MKESRLYSFLDSKKGFAIHFLEGTKLIKDIFTIHNVGPCASDYYKNTLLSAQHMLTFLKPGESLGVYIDSEEPYFRFKVEMGYQGTMRTLLLPEDFSDFPKEVSGIARISKIFPSQTPYSSIVKLQNQAPDKIINQILSESYQTNSQVLVSEQQDQSVMLTKLPPIDVNKEGLAFDDVSLEDFIEQKESFIQNLFREHVNDIELIVNKFEQDQFSYLSSKEVKFFCPCSKERMMSNLINLHHNDLNDVFAEDNHVDIRCDYCNTMYNITKEDLASFQ
jgi:molecular chaperone Hsp33